MLICFPPARRSSDTRAEERREVLQAVLEALTSHAPDPAEMAACHYLLRHLNEAADAPAA